MFQREFPSIRNMKIQKNSNYFLQLIFLLVLIWAASPTYAQENSAEGSASSVERGTFFGAKPTEYPDWFKESFLEFSDDIAEAAEEGKRVLIIFQQDGCPYCNLLVERNLSQKNILELVQQKFDVISINIWGDREIVTVGGQSYTEKEFSEALKVQFTPTLLFFNEKGKAILKLNGYLPPREFLTALTYVAEHHEKKTPYRDFVRAAHAGTSASQKALISQPFFQSPPHNLNRYEDSRPLAVFFEQPECPNCETLHNKVLADPEVSKFLDGFHVVQLDMWSNDQLTDIEGNVRSFRDWASSLDISYAPTIVLFDRNGKEVIRSEAWFRKFHTSGLFEYVSSGAFLEQPNFQRYLSARADHLIEQGIDVNIWE